MMNRKWMAIAALLFLTAVCGGCRDRTDVNLLAVVIGVGVDRVNGPEPFRLTVQVVNSASVKGPGEGGGGQEKPFLLITGQGKSLDEAVNNLAKTAPRKLLFSHSKVIVLGKALAETDITDVTDYFARSRQFRLTNKVVVAEKTAKEVLEAKSDIEKLPAMGLDTLLTAAEQNFVYPINLNNFMLYLNNEVGVSYAPLVRKAASGVYLQETAVFKNKRLVGLLDENDSKSLLWIIDKMHGDTVVLPPPRGNGENPITVGILEGHSKVVSHITDSGITMEIVCTAQGDLRETDNLRHDPHSLQLYREISQEVEKVLAARMVRMLARAQKELNADFPGFGERIHNDNPAQWRLLKENWDRHFPEIKYTVTFKVTIAKAGVTKIKRP